MALEDYYNTLLCVNRFTEGTAPDYEQTFALQDEFYGLLDRQSGSRIWQEKGSSIKIDSKMYCSSDVTITEKDRITAIENHTLAAADLGKYHKTIGGAWTLTASAAIGTAAIFYGATTNTGTGRKADGGVYTIVPPIKNPNMMDRHLELLLQKVGE
jgi:hypothetical protein